MITCYRDSNGIATCEELLTLVEEVAARKRESWKGTGNAHTLIISSEGVQIENDWDSSLGMAKLSLEEFRTCIEAWRKCISS